MSKWEVLFMQKNGRKKRIATTGYQIVQRGTNKHLDVFLNKRDAEEELAYLERAGQGFFYEIQKTIVWEQSYE